MRVVGWAIAAKPVWAGAGDASLPTLPAQRCGATAMSDLGYLALGLGLLAVYLAAMAAVLFGAAGTFAVPMFWAYLALFAVLCVGASAAVYLQSPDLVKERLRPGEGEQDRVSVRALNLLMFVQLLLAGLDVGRLHWSATVPLALQILGLVGFATGMGLTTWAMLVNRFFSRAVRLQPDRGHARSSARVPWVVWNKPRQSVWLPSRRRKSAQPPASRDACGSTPPRSPLPPAACAPGKPWMGWSPAL